MQWGFLEKDVYSCDVYHLRIRNANKTIDDVKGEHARGKSNSDVKALFINDKTCFFVPKGIGRFFKHLENLQIRNSALNEVSKVDLRPFSELIGLWLDGNNLKFLEADLFEFNRNLQFIDFRNNRIQTISADILDPIFNLREILFSGNVCISNDARNLDQLKDVTDKINEKCRITNDGKQKPDS